MKTWNDLLWLHLTGQLTDDADRQAFAAYLTEARYREELAEWQVLDDTVEYEVATRVDDLPPLTDDFLANLPEQRTQYSNGRSQHAPINPIDGPRPLSDNSEAEPMTQNDSITLPDDRSRITFPQVRVSLPLVAAVTAIIVIGGLLFAGINNPPPEDDVTAAGINAQITQTPAPSQTTNASLESNFRTATAIIAQATQAIRDLTATATPITLDTDATIEAAVQATLDVINAQATANAAATATAQFTVPEPIGCESEQARITSPTHGSTITVNGMDVNERIIFTGTAFTDDNGSYRVEFVPPLRAGFNAVELPIAFMDGPPATITEMGTLAELAPLALQQLPYFYTQNGIYDFILTVFDADETVVASCQISAIITGAPTGQEPIPLATPILRFDWPTQTNTPTHTATPQNTVTNTPTTTPTFTPTPAISRTPVTCISYTVMDSDTLLGIAVRFNVPAADLLAANGIDDPDTYTLMVGETLIIPGGGCVLQRTAQATQIVVVSPSPVPSATFTATPTLPPETNITALPPFNRVSGVIAGTEQPVNVRSGPGVEFDIVSTLDPGNAVTVIALSGQWSQIELSDQTNNPIGWVFSALIEPVVDPSALITVVPSPTLPPGTGITALPPFNFVSGIIAGIEQPIVVRSGPGTEFEATGTLDPGTLVDVVARSGGWSQVILTNQADTPEGWVFSDFVQPVADAPAFVTIVPGPTLPSGSGVATMAVSPIPATALPPGMPSPTWTPTPIPRGAGMPIGPSRTPIPFDRPTDLTPRPDPRASITPSEIEPIIAGPATLNQTAFLPGGDFSSSVAWSPDGETVAAAAYTGIWLFDPNAIGSSLSLIPDPSGEGLMSVAFSPDGDLLVTFGWDGTTRIWDVATRTQLAELPEAGLWNDAYFIDERAFASTGSSRRVDIIDLDADPPEVVIDDSGRLNTLHIHLPDDRIVLDFDGNLSVESINNRVPILNIDATPTSMVLNDAGTQLAVTTTSNRVLLIDLETQTIQRTQRFGGRVLDVEFNPAGDLIAVSVNQNGLKTVELWQPDDDTRTPLVVYDVIIGDVAFSPTGDQLVVMATDGRVIVLDLE